VSRVVPGPVPGPGTHDRRGGSEDDGSMFNQEPDMESTTLSQAFETLRRGVDGTHGAPAAR